MDSNLKNLGTANNLHGLEIRLDPCYITEQDSRIVQFNKRKFVELLKSLQKTGKLLSKTINDFHVVGHETTEQQKNKKIENLKVIDIQEFNPSTVDTKKNFKTLKKQTIDLTKKMFAFADLDKVADLCQKNVNPLEGVFCEAKADNIIELYQLTPHFDNNLNTWIHNCPENTNNKRNATHLKKVLLGALEGLTFLHRQKIIHCELEVENFLVTPENECVITGIGQSFETSIANSSSNSKNNTSSASELNCYRTRRSIFDFQVNENMFSLHKTDLLTPKVDIYAFGAILQKLIFPDHPETEIDAQKIENQLESFFFFSPDESNQEGFVCSEELPKFLEKTIKLSLSEDPNQRPSAQQLLDELKSVKICESLEEAFQRALRYSEEDGTSRNYTNALKLLEKLAKLQFPPAAYYAGFFHLHGVGGYLNKKRGTQECTKAAEKALPYFTHRSSNLNDLHAHYALSTMYYFGLGVPKNPKFAFMYTKLAADLGHSAAICNIAMMLEDRSSGPPGPPGPHPPNGGDGSGPPANPQQQRGPPPGLINAFASYQKAAERGDCLGQFFMGFMAEEIEHNTDKAFTFYKMAANNHFVRAYHKVGNCYEYGDGADEDEDLAVQWYTLGAEAGDTESKLKMGHICESKAKYEQAKKWYKLAAEDGESNEGYASLIDLFSKHGNDNANSLKRDSRIAVHYMKLAVKHGDESFNYQLGKYSENMVHNFVAAERYYAASAKSEIFKAVRRLENLIDDGKIRDELKFETEFDDEKKLFE